MASKKEMPFLINPAGKPRRVRRKAKGAKPRKARGGTRKNKPAPNTTSSGTAGGSTMAGSKRRRGAGGRFTKGGTAKRKRRNPATAAVKSNPPRRRRSRVKAAARTLARTRRRTRRNPPGLFGDLVPFASEAAMGAVGVLGGKIIARKARSAFGQGPGTLLGSLMEAGTGIVAGLVVSSFSPEWGERVAVGGILAPMETLVQQLGVKGISDTLGDDGFLVGADTGVDLVSAYDDGSALGDGEELAGYIPADTSSDALAGYVYGAQVA